MAVETVVLPDYKETVVYNTDDLLDDFIVIGQGYRSGAFYLLEFDGDNHLINWELQ